MHNTSTSGLKLKKDVVTRINWLQKKIHRVTNDSISVDRCVQSNLHERGVFSSGDPINEYLYMMIMPKDVWMEFQVFLDIFEAYPSFSLSKSLFSVQFVRIRQRWWLLWMSLPTLPQRILHYRFLPKTKLSWKYITIDRLQQKILLERWNNLLLSKTEDNTPKWYSKIPPLSQ